MEKRPPENPADEQKRYELANRDLMKMFTKLFIAVIATVSLLAGGLYVSFANKTIGIVMAGASAIGLLFAVLLAYKIQLYIAEHNKE